MNVFPYLTSAATLFSFATSCQDIASETDNWSAWRGPNLNGAASDTSDPPTVWTPTENIGWTTDLPGQGTSTPIVWQDRVFLLSAKPTQKQADSPVVSDDRSRTTPPDVYYQFTITCVGRQTGRILWSRVAAEEVPHEGHHPTHTYAGSSPTTDGDRLYVSFGSRGIFAYSLDGDLLWKTDLGNMRTRYGWGEAVTPVIHGDSLIVNWDQEEGSFITCLDPSTGRKKWSTPRPGEVTSWNTPLVTEIDGRTVVVVNGTHKVRAYDLTSGEELWSCGGQTVNAIPSPIRFENSAIVMSGYRGSIAASIPLSSRGDVTGSEKVSWTAKGGTPYVPSPLLVEDRLYFTGTNRNVLSVLNAKTGIAMSAPMRLSALRNIYASPVASRKHIYILDREGTCVVLTNATKPKIVAVNKLNDATDASPVIVGHQLLLRSWTRLYSIVDTQIE